MIEWIILGVSFLSLYVGVFWLHVVSFQEKVKKDTNYFPLVSLIVPARNEEKGLWKTVHSLVSVDYPKEKLEIIIVDHGSTDKTAEIAKQVIAQYPSYKIILVEKKRQQDEMKAHAFNAGLAYAKGEFIACVDADTLVMRNCLREMVAYFEDAQVGAVISTIKVQQAKNMYEKIQHLEYIFATFTRSLMSKIDTLHVTPGALSIYRKSLFDKYGGFDENNITEDLEMAMRLRYHHYTIKLAQNSITYTKVPDTFQSLWNQRVRWFRGFIYNSIKYRKMIFNKKYNLIGSFQYPLNILTLFTLVLMFILLSYTIITTIITQFSKLHAIGWEYFAFDVNNIPTIKELFLNMNILLLFPIAISFLIALLIYHLAHKSLKEKWKYPFALGSYLTIYPFLRSLHWIVAVYKEIFQTKNKWK
ncbi:MAG: glycosyltransferase family 2 protein [bacterium]|nr:glycosyltransferase family 2 protein [bacterium]